MQRSKSDKHAKTQKTVRNGVSDKNRDSTVSGKRPKAHKTERNGVSGKRHDKIASHNRPKARRNSGAQPLLRHSKNDKEPKTEKNGAQQAAQSMHDYESSLRITYTASAPPVEYYSIMYVLLKITKDYLGSIAKTYPECLRCSAFSRARYKQ